MTRYNQENSANFEREKVLTEINTLNKNVADCRKLLIAGDFDGNDLRSVKLEAEKQIIIREARLPEISTPMISIRADLKKAISNLQKAEDHFKASEMKVKRDIIGSFYPENLCFDGVQHRTARVNDLDLAISLINKKLRGQKKREDLGFSSLPATVVYISTKVVLPHFWC